MAPGRVPVVGVVTRVLVTYRNVWEYLVGVGGWRDPARAAARALVWAAKEAGYARAVTQAGSAVPDVRVDGAADLEEAVRRLVAEWLLAEGGSR